MLHQVHLRDRYIVRHLFGEVLQQVTVAGHGLFEGVHYLGANQMLRRNYVVEIVRQCLFEHVALRLPILLCNGDPSRRLRLDAGLAGRS